MFIIKKIDCKEEIGKKENWKLKKYIKYFLNIWLKD